MPLIADGSVLFLMTAELKGFTRKIFNIKERSRDSTEL